MNKRTQQRRFDELHNVAANVIDYRYFNMMTFGNGLSNKKSACGTTACLAGWAGTVSYFQRLGIVMRNGSLEITGRSHGTAFADEKFREVFGTDDRMLIGMLFYADHPSGRARVTTMNRVRNVMISLGLKAPPRAK